MPTIRIVDTQTISHEIKKYLPHSCCDAFANFFRDLRRGADNLIYWGNNQVKHCPYCGEKIIIDLHEILPPRYMKKAGT